MYMYIYMYILYFAEKPFSFFIHFSQEIKLQLRTGTFHNINKFIQSFLTFILSLYLILRSRNYYYSYLEIFLVL